MSVACAKFQKHHHVHLTFWLVDSMGFRWHSGFVKLARSADHAPLFRSLCVPLTGYIPHMLVYACAATVGDPSVTGMNATGVTLRNIRISATAKHELGPQEPNMDLAEGVRAPAPKPMFGCCGDVNAPLCDTGGVHPCDVWILGGHAVCICKQVRKITRKRNTRRTKQRSMVCPTREFC